MEQSENHEPADSDAEGWPSDEQLADLLARSGSPELFGDTEDGFVTTLRSLAEKLDLPPEASVIYPGSSTHVGVARVFGSEHVTHVDPDQEAVRVLAEHGYHAEQTGIESYTPPQPADLMVALNSYGKPTEEILERTVKPGGWIIANNYSHWAHELAQLPNLSLKLAVLPSYNSPDAHQLEGSEIPEDATNISTRYIKNVLGRKLLEGTEDDHDSAISQPTNPDGLFVFQRIT